MIIITISIVTIAVSLVLLICTLSTEGWDLLSYNLYSGFTQAFVIDEKPFTLNLSKGTVEEQIDDENFERIKTTEDNVVGYFPFYHQIFESNKVQYVFEWKVNNKIFRGHYRYLKKKGTWQTGQEISLHFLTDKPWKYSVNDKSLRRSFAIKVTIYTILLFIGIATLVVIV